MSEALACFTYLAENAPVWIKSLDELQSRIQGRQPEAARVVVPLIQAQNFKIKKTSSNESIRQSGPDTSVPSTAGLEITSAPQACDTQHVTTTTEQVLTPTRKRKTISLLSVASGTHKYRSRASVTVYYDSEVQESFGRLVRNISTGRNNIRKSRMVDRVWKLNNIHETASSDSARPNRTPLLRTARSASGMPRFDAYIEENLRSSRRIALRPPPTINPLTATLSDTEVQKTDAIAEADAALDKAQNFCERGAHQFLRDGDCSEEVAGARAAFQAVARISLQEVERLKEANAGNDIQQEKKEREEEEDTTKLGMNPQQRGGISHHPGLIETSGPIEADDDEEGSDDEYDDPLRYRVLLSG
jgi:hypothetical protein